MRRDLVATGVLWGLVGNLFKEAAVWPLHWLGWVRYTFVHIAAGYFVDQKMIDNPVALATGFLTDFTLAAVLGVLLYYLLRRTGGDYAILKGAVYGLITYALFYGLLMALDVTRASLLTPLPNLLLAFPHALYGVCTAYFLRRYGMGGVRTS